MTRNYESNGPDVKIRGNAQHIADKYIALARDAQASGDRIMAENYLQHAEHYMRIILSAQAQTGQPVIRDDAADNDAEDSDGADTADNSMPEPAGSGPQPVIEGTPSEVALTTDLGTGFDTNNAAEPKAERPRRPVRRRMPRKAEADNETLAGQSTAGETTAEHPRKKRRSEKDPEDNETPGDF